MNQIDDLFKKLNLHCGSSNAKKIETLKTVRRNSNI